MSDLSLKRHLKLVTSEPPAEDNQEPIGRPLHYIGRVGYIGVCHDNTGEIVALISWLDSQFDNGNLIEHREFVDRQTAAAQLISGVTDDTKLGYSVVLRAIDIAAARELDLGGPQDNPKTAITFDAWEPEPVPQTQFMPTPNLGA